MHRRLFAILFVVSLFLLLPAFASPPVMAAQHPEVEKTPDQDANNSPSRMLKAQHEEVKKTASKLVDLATDVEADIDKQGGENVLPLDTLKKLEEIEKLAKKLRTMIKQ